MDRIKILVSLSLAALVALLAPARKAEACSCVLRSPEQYVEASDLVFFARAQKASTVGKDEVQPLTVLHSLKGRPGKEYKLTRPGRVMTPCSRIFLPGEVALVFIKNGGASICDGNYDLAAVQLEKTADYLNLGKPAPTTPDLPGVREALIAGLGPHLNVRSITPVNYAPLAEAQVQAGKTTFHFVRGRLKHAVDMHHALRAGPLVFAKGRYGLVGYNFSVLLLHLGESKYEVLAAKGALGPR